MVTRGIGIVGIDIDVKRFENRLCSKEAGRWSITSESDMHQFFR